MGLNSALSSPRSEQVSRRQGGGGGGGEGRSVLTVQTRITVNRMMISDQSL